MTASPIDLERNHKSDGEGRDSGRDSGREGRDSGRDSGKERRREKERDRDRDDRKEKRRPPAHEELFRKARETIDRDRAASYARRSPKVRAY